MNRITEAKTLNAMMGRILIQFYPDFNKFQAVAYKEASVQLNRSLPQFNR